MEELKLWRIFHSGGVTTLVDSWLRWSEMWVLIIEREFLVWTFGKQNSILLTNCYFVRSVNYKVLLWWPFQLMPLSGWDLQFLWKYFPIKSQLFLMNKLRNWHIMCTVFWIENKFILSKKLHLKNLRFYFNFK